MCGIIGVWKNEIGVKNTLYYGLIELQHRGQEANGVAVFDGINFNLVKYKGLVTEKKLEDYPEGILGIGHLRYSTIGKKEILIDRFAQPSILYTVKNGLSLCHNGNIVNYSELEEELKRKGNLFQTDADHEVILHILAEELKNNKTLEEAVNTCMNKLEGAYSVIGITGNNELFAFRDRYGIHPLVYGMNENSFIIASETPALIKNNVRKYFSVKPGELIIIKDWSIKKKQIVKATPKQCMFEFVYFSRPDSVIDGKSVREARFNLGKNMALEYSLKNRIEPKSIDYDFISPVPDTSRTAAEGINEITGLPIREALIKNRYIPRTFIMPKDRSKAVKSKLSIMKDVIFNKKILFVDDSIVRGNTSKTIIEMVKEAKPKKIGLWITCPKIIAPCYYGIDMRNYNEFVAFEKNVEEIKEYIGVDELFYASRDCLKKSLGLEDICESCLTNKYFTPLAKEKAKEQMKWLNAVKKIKNLKTQHFV